MKTPMHKVSVIDLSDVGLAVLAVVVIVVTAYSVAYLKGARDLARTYEEIDLCPAVFRASPTS